MTTNDNAAIEERMREAENAEEPGDLKTGEVISGSPEMTMTTSELQSAGYVYVYDTNTADRSVVNRNMLQQALAKTRSDGSYVFSTRPPEGMEHISACYMLMMKTGKSTRLWGFLYVKNILSDLLMMYLCICKIGIEENGRQ
jgi:hypothetical protein